MTRAEKVREAQALRAEGLKLREIGERMGAKLKTVHTWLNDPDLSKQRARRQQYAGTCVDCGGKTDGSAGRTNAPERCIGCIAHLNDERNARILEAWERGDTGVVIAAREGLSYDQVRGVVDHTRHRKGVPVTLHKRRHRELWPLIERRWREGATGPEIAAEAGTTPENIYFMAGAMRRAGIDLPHFKRGGVPRLPEHVRRRAAQLYAEGQPSTKVAAALGIAHTSVLNAARSEGVPVRKSGRQQKKAAA